jgi:hypothetical protein
MKTRKSSLPPRTTRLARSTAPIAKRGPAKARREKTYKAFMASAAWKKIRAAAIERAGHRCEVMEDVEFRVGGTQQTQRIAFRCEATTDLTAHHKTYARFGGKELPEDLEVQCRAHHNRLHALQGKRIGLASRDTQEGQ